MKIIISKKHLNQILDNSNIISEQVQTSNDEKSLIVLQNRINDIIDKKQKEILDQTGIKVLVNENGVNLEIGKKDFLMKPMVKGIYALIIPPNNALSFGKILMDSILPEIEKIPEYKSLVNVHPELKDQIQQNGIQGTLYTDDQDQGMFKFTVSRKPMAMEDMKYAIEFGREYPLGEFLNRNKLIYKFKNGTFGTLESGALFMNLKSIDLRINSPATKTVTQPITINTVAIGDVFNFDSVEFKDPASVEKQISSFVRDIKMGIQQYGQQFIDHVKSQNPTVFGYSSVDGDPDQNISGGYKPCSGSGTRRNYDMCLSRERSRVIADMLNQYLPELGGAIKFKGLGETTKWGPGWTPQNPTIPEQTAPNRRYFLSGIKPFTGQA